MRRSQNGDTRFSRSGRRSGTARHASFACLAPGSGTAEKEQSGKVCAGVKAEVHPFTGQGVELPSPLGRLFSADRSGDGAGGRPIGAGVGMVHAVSSNSKNLKD